MNTAISRRFKGDMRTGYDLWGWLAAVLLVVAAALTLGITSAIMHAGSVAAAPESPIIGWGD